MKSFIIGVSIGLLAALSIVFPRLDTLASTVAFPADIEIIAEVKLKDTNEPVSGVTVTLTGKRSGSAYQACVTNELGAVTMQVKKPGTYTIRVTTDQFEVAETDVKVVAGDRQLSVQLLLTPKESTAS
jgi:hypothetical protein